MFRCSFRHSRSETNEFSVGLRCCSLRPRVGCDVACTVALQQRKLYLIEVTSGSNHLHLLLSVDRDVNRVCRRLKLVGDISES